MQQCRSNLRKSLINAVILEKMRTISAIKRKKTKLKSVAVTLKPPSRGNYLESSHSQGGIAKEEPTTEVEEVEILPNPRKDDYEIIDVDEEVPVQDVIDNEELERMRRAISSKKRANQQIMETYNFFYNLTMKQK